MATRIVIASRDIDLPIISRDRRVKGQGPDKYPPCDVALYHTAFEQPGQPGTTYIYAHAREGMFLPLLEASTRRNGASLIGALVQVYTSDEREHVYQITRVKRHALDFSLALDAPPDAHQLILQTSEGPRGTVPKLQVLAEPVDVLPVSQSGGEPASRDRAPATTRPESDPVDLAEVRERRDAHRDHDADHHPEATGVHGLAHAEDARRPHRSRPGPRSRRSAAS